VLTVTAILALGCGCSEALVDDGGQLVACAAEPGGCWWCECCNVQESPQVCDHAEALLVVLLSQF
jgi:hypothetical protein